MEIELEKTYLLKEIPEGIKDCNCCEIIDIYLPSSVRHPILRIRSRGKEREITKKAPVKTSDSSEQKENTIILSEEEFKELSENLNGKRLKKKRYYLPVKDKTAEIDFFLDKLKGLCTVDFEFDSKKEKNNFSEPEFCLADVTQENFIAGGMLAGKKYSDIEERLKGYNYRKLKYDI